MASPRLLLALIFLPTVALLSDCRTSGNSGLLDAATTTTPPAAPAANGGAVSGDDNLAFAQRCFSEMGLTAAQVATITDWSCLSGTEVPITYNGTPVTSASWAGFVQGNRLCDDPQWLTDGCHPFDFVQKKAIGNIDMVLNCRQKYFPDQDDTNGDDPALVAGMSKWERFLAYANAVKSGDQNAITKYRRFAFLFNDMGWILRNRVSGQVCYFTQFDQDFFGGFIPNPGRATPPDDATFKATLAAGITAGLATSGLSAADKATVTALANDPNLDTDAYKTTTQTFYFPPNSNTSCVECHSYGGFNYSPFITGANVLPSLTTVSRPPFLPIGSDLDDAVRAMGTVEVQVTGDSTCTACHRLSSQGSPGSRGCNFFDSATGSFDATLTASYTTTGLNYPLRSWMPFNHGIGDSPTYGQTYGQAIASADCCCQHPSAKGCGWRRYGPTLAEVDTPWRTGVAPADIEAGFGIGNDTAIDCSLGNAPAWPVPHTPADGPVVAAPPPAVPVAPVPTAPAAPAPTSTP